MFIKKINFFKCILKVLFSFEFIQCFLLWENIPHLQNLKPTVWKSYEAMSSYSIPADNLLFPFSFPVITYCMVSDVEFMNVTDCGQTCPEPLTSAPFGSPCGCVIPMRIELLLGVSVYAIFPVVNELEIEIAAGTYLKQSQVSIIGASADSLNQEKTVVGINLVPLGEKFDNTTATLTYQRFLQKKVLLNRNLFGDYDVMYVSYPGKLELS